MPKPQDISIALIGSGGRMGSMLAKELGKQGFTIECLDLLSNISNGTSNSASKGKSKALTASATSSYDERLAKALSASQVILLCVPVGALAKLMEKIGPLLSPHHLLMDITSVKCLPMEVMEKAFTGSVVGAHPLFGPKPLPEDKKTILVRGKNASPQDCQLAECIFTSLQSTIHWATAEEHDKGVAIAQTLNFTVSAAFFATLAKEAKEQNIQQFLTPSFKRHLEAARKHLTEDTAMFLEFSAMNPFFNEAMASYETTLARISEGCLPAVAQEAQQWYATNELI